MWRITIKNFILNFKKGFTLVEMFISMIALLILMAIVYFLFGSHASRGVSIESQIDIQQDARTALQLISRDLRGAHSYEFDGKTLKINVFCGKPLVSFAGKGSNAVTNTVEYTRENNGVLLYKSGKIGNTPPKELAKNISSFQVFTCNENQTEYVAVKLEAEIDVMFDREVYNKVKTTLFTKVVPRYISLAKKYDGFFSLVDDYEDY